MWEYKFLVFSLGGHGDETMKRSEEELNAEGADGWEAVTLLPKMGKNECWCIALMKRQRSGTKT